MRFLHLLWPLLLGACSPRVELGRAPEAEPVVDERAQFRERMMGRWRGSAKLFPLEWDVDLEMVFDGDSYTVVCTLQDSTSAGAGCPSFGGSGSYTWGDWEAPGVASLAATEAVMFDGQHVTDADIRFESVWLDSSGQRLSFWRVWDAPRQPFRELAGQQLQAFLELLVGGPVEQPDASVAPAPGDASVAPAPGNEEKYTTIAQVVLDRVR